MRTIEYLKSNGVDLEKSLEYLGDMETYNETLKEFYDNLDEKLSLLEKYYREVDLANYAIYAHSLKSDCRYLGFTELGELAYKHEMAGKAEDYDTIKDSYSLLIEETKKVKLMVANYFEDEEEIVSIEPTSLNLEDIILVADDSEVIRIFVRKIFDAEYELCFAEDGEEALQVIKEHKDDKRIKAILLDLNMPKIDGFGVLDYMKDNDLFRKIPVTIISGDSSKDSIDRAFNYPIVDMLNKPFNEEKVKDAVEKTINYFK